MKVKAQKSRSNIFNIKLVVLLITTGIFLAGCGGGGGDDGVVGTGYNVNGIAATGDAIANSLVALKDVSGSSKSASTGADGKFSFADVSGNGPFLLRVVNGTTGNLYGVGHKGTGDTVTRNIHPFTDLIIRNWFATKALDIDSEFDGTGAISSMPTVDQINAIETEINKIVEVILTNFGISADVDLLATPFEANGTGFDAFILNSQVVIQNNQITLIVVNPETSIEGIVIDAIDLNTDFTSAIDSPPTTPQNVRGLVAGVDEIVVVWEVSTDDKGVAGYNVYRDNDLIATTPYPVYSDTGLSTGVDYSYEIVAIDGRGQISPRSIPSAPVNLDTPDVTAPPAPTNLTATALDSDIQLNWTQAEINDVYGFRVLRGSAGNVTETVANITSTTYTDYGLVSTTEYCYKVVAYDASGNDSAASGEVCATVGGVNPGPSAVSFSATAYTVSESTPSITITVNRTGDISEAISVDYATMDNTATAGQDYSSASGTLNWVANETVAKTFAVQIISDSVAEGDETVNLTLSNPSASTGLGTNATAVLTITNFTSGVCAGEITDRDIIVDTTLSEPCYKIPNGISISNTATLTVSPGVRLEFAAGQDLLVNDDGALNAVGTSTDPITFTGAQQTPGYWDGINIRGSNNVNNTFDYVTVEYGGGNVSSGFSNVTLEAASPRLKMQHSILRHSLKYGLSVNDSAILEEFSENIITLNADAPVVIDINKVGALDVLSQYSGNGAANYIQIERTSSFDAVSTDQTWRKLDVPYKVALLNTDIEAELTIEPGVELIFIADANFQVTAQGTLLAIGTASEQIKFTAEQPTRGYWHGIQFTFNSTGNELDYVVVEYGGGNTGNGEGAVNVFGIDGRLKIHNTLIRESLRYGFDFNRGITLDMLNVTSTQNTEGAGIIHPDDIGKLDKNSDYSGNTIDRIVWTIGDIDTSQTIQNLGVPYYVEDHEITGNVDIEPGTVLSFESGGGFDIKGQGSLTAMGTDTENIIFTGRQSISGYWDGIQFFTGSLANVLDYTVIEYAGKAGAGNTEGLVGVFFMDSRADITNSVLRHSETNGIWFYDNTSGVESNNIYENIIGDNVFIAN